MSGRPGFFIAGVEVVVGAVALALGFESAATSCALAGALILTFACVLQVIQNHHERKTNGRHRKALEAHRAGTGGSAGDGARAGRGASGRAGAGMSTCPCPDCTRANARGLAYPAYTLKLKASSSASANATQPASRPVDDFDGKTSDFAVGVITGTRAFAVDKLGRLLGVTYPAVWTPGENVAKCMVRDDAYFTMGGFQLSYNEGPRASEADRASHSLVDCAHGFYGYYEGSNDYYAPGRVMGVIEAYGETVIGTRGFRASKARIVALHLPDGEQLSKSARALVTRNYAGIPIFESFDAMVAEFPPDDGGHGINPTTDPDFWTRKA